MRAKTLLTITIFFYVSIMIIIFVIMAINGKQNNNKTKMLMERAYFDGQRDAINGDVRIKLTSDSLYVWTKSCWDNGEHPDFNPTYLDTKE